MKKYKTRDAVLQALADDRHVRASEVSAHVLRMKVWVYGAGQPGCLYDSGPYYSPTKEAAICDLVSMADDGESGEPRGMLAELRRNHSATHGHWHFELSQDTLASLLSG